jgi:prepilin-type N-terminal cleavage/methylation domain-containing protein
MPRRRGFTLVEMSFVIAVIALIIGLSVPAYHALVLRAKVGEARAMLEDVSHLELQHRRDHGAFLACEAPATEPVPKAEVLLPTRACWATLGFSPTGPLRYRYQVLTQGGSYTVVAEGDLDADGVTSRFALDGRTFTLTVERELE